MSDWKPAAITLIAVFVLAILINLVVAAFEISPESLPTDSFMNNTIDTINNGYNFTINLPIVPDFQGSLPSPVPSAFRSFIVSQLTFLSIIPDILLIPFLILLSLSLIWSIVSLILP